MFKTLLRLFVLILGIAFLSVSGLQAEESQSMTGDSLESIPSEQVDEDMTLPEGGADIEAQSATEEPVDIKSAPQQDQDMEESESDDQKDE